MLPLVMTLDIDIDRELSKIGLNCEGIGKEIDALLLGTTTPREEMSSWMIYMLQFLNLGFTQGLDRGPIPQEIENPDLALPQVFNLLGNGNIITPFVDLNRLFCGLYRISHKTGLFVTQGGYDEHTGIMMYVHIATNALRRFIGPEATADMEKTLIDTHFGKTSH